MAMIPFDDRDGFIWMNGEMLPWRDAKLHVLTHALHYASAVFEGERVYGGQIFKLTEHTERLHRSANILDFQIPWSVAEIDQACRDVIAKNNIVDGYVRPIAWRGSEMMGVSGQGALPKLAIACWEWPAYFSADARMQGIRMDWAMYDRPDPRTAPTSAKAAGLYMICTLSKHKAEAAGFSDALFKDYRGYLAEGTGANLFLVIDGKLHTPTPDCFLDGITRRTVIDLAKRNKIEVIERHILPEELDKAQEVFICGTAVEVTPVREIAGKMFTPGQVCRTLMDAYDAEVRKPVAVMASDAA